MSEMGNTIQEDNLDMESDKELAPFGEEEQQKPETGRRRKRKGSGVRGDSHEDAKVRRLEKNRQSAKESRVRKKQYMQRLEERNQILEKEKAKLLRRINTLEEKERLSSLSYADTANQLLSGR
mmetsp:Transcript_2654/g.4119  ORF Transcript_2654/g.4119 Transcript_2654/m.4119 type:complete len:123 (-) Transcript_2654:1592-1960(-)